MKIGVILSGNGVYDGSEIQESVFALWAIHECGAEAICMAPDMNQHHVVNHITGDEMNEQRNVLVESARIARGNIHNISEVSHDQLDALVMPGGFGVAKNLTKWAFSGPEGEIHAEVKRLINEMVMNNKPIAALCMAPTTVAKALEGSGVKANLTVGTTAESSPYEIDAISQGMEAAGAVSSMKTVREILVDEQNKIVTAPCYMMEANISEIKNNVEQAIKKVVELVN